MGCVLFFLVDDDFFTANMVLAFIWSLSLGDFIVFGVCVDIIGYIVLHVSTIMLCVSSSSRCDANLLVGCQHLTVDSMSDACIMAHLQIFVKLARPLDPSTLLA